MEPVVYQVHKGLIDVPLDPVYSFCFYERIHIITNTIVYDPDGTESTIEDPALFGFMIESGKNMTSTLSI